MFRFLWIVAGATALYVLAMINQPIAAETPAAVRSDSVILSVGSTQSLEMKTRRPIKTSSHPGATVLRIEADKQKPNIVLLTGLKPGLSRVTLTDIDGAEEKIVVAIEDPPVADAAAADRLATAQKVRQHLVTTLQTALKTEQDALTRILMAKTLIKVAPENAIGAQELVKALIGTDDMLPVDAYEAIGEVIPAAPPALIAALTPVLKNSEEIHRRRAAVLLSRIDPKMLP